MAEREGKMICPNCNHPYSETSILRGYELCRLCGVRYLPFYTDLTDYYSSGEYRSRIKQLDERAHQQRRADHIAPYIGNPRVFIDVGCSMGVLMDKVRETGAECYGVDIDTVLTRDVYRNLSDVPKQADCISLIHSLEHMPRPLETLTDVYNKLNTGGRVVVEVPNGGVNEDKQYYHGAFGFPHVVMFDDESLSWTMQAAGFEIEEVIIHGKGGMLNASNYYYLLTIGKK